MKIKSISKKADSLIQQAIKLDYLKRNDLNFETEEILNVYGILLLEKKLYYLLSEKFETFYLEPFWHRAELFTIIDHTIPPIFYFNASIRKNYREEDEMMAIWSYKEMALDYNHHDALINREHKAVEIFFKRKEEIDEYEEMRNIKL